jgi:hypothetical protein
MHVTQMRETFLFARSLARTPSKGVSNYVSTMSVDVSTMSVYGALSWGNDAFVNAERDGRDLDLNAYENRTEDKHEDEDDHRREPADALPARRCPCPDRGRNGKCIRQDDDQTQDIGDWDEARREKACER